MANLRETVNIGHCQVLWTPDGGVETDMGFTKEGVELEIDASVYERTVHELAAPFGASLDELAITSDIILAETHFENIAIAMNGLLTTVAGPPAAESVDLNPIRGEEMSFGKLVFHPRKRAASDKSRDVTVWNAIVMGSTSRIFKGNEDGTVTFSIKAGAYFDSVSSKWKIYTEGDPSTDVGFEL